MRDSDKSSHIAHIEEELRLHNRAMAASSCGITIADATLADMPLIYINDAFEHITGYNAREVMGLNCRFLQGEDRNQPGLDKLRMALKKGENITLVLRNYHKSGALFWNELFLSPIYDPANRLTHFVGIQTDVTARKTVEEKLDRKNTELEQTLAELRETQTMLVHAEKMNALGQMVAGVAHEINNPVSFVNSNLHSLTTSLRDISQAYLKLEQILLAQGDAAQREAARIIRESADLDFILGDVNELVQDSLRGLGRVKKIVDNLRTFSRLDEAEFKPCDLLENIQSTLDIARLELGDRVKVILDIDTLPLIEAYPAELNQVFLNIITNAAHAIAQRGTLTIRGRDKGDVIVLEFIDTGAGMTEDVLENIFNPFFTTKPAGLGTGLGLAIAYKIITDHHHGTITARSAPGEGTTFTITLPKEIHKS